MSPKFPLDSSLSTSCLKKTLGPQCLLAPWPSSIQAGESDTPRGPVVMYSLKRTLPWRGRNEHSHSEYPWKREVHSHATSSCAAACHSPLVPYKTCIIYSTSIKKGNKGVLHPTCRHLCRSLQLCRMRPKGTESFPKEQCCWGKIYYWENSN